MEEAARMQAAFDRALESQLPRIYAYLRRLGASAAAADDLVQETFLIAWQGVSKVRAEGDLKPWLYGIARRCYLKHRTRAVREATEQIGADLAAAPADDPGSDERLAAHLVREALLHLPDKYLQPLALVYWEELSYEEAAQALSIPVGTLGWRVHKALKLIRKALAEEGAEHEAGSPGSKADRTACPPVED